MEPDKKKKIAIIGAGVAGAVVLGYVLVTTVFAKGAKQVTVSFDVTEFVVCTTTGHMTVTVTDASGTPIPMAKGSIIMDIDGTPVGSPLTFTCNAAGVFTTTLCWYLDQVVAPPATDVVGTLTATATLTTNELGFAQVGIRIRAGQAGPCPSPC